MSAGDTAVPESSRPSSPGRVWFGLLIALAGLALAAALAAGGAIAGHALLGGRFTGAVAGAGVGLFLSLLAIWRWGIGDDNPIELGCLAVIVGTLVVLAYLAAVRVEQRAEELRRQEAIVTPGNQTSTSADAARSTWFWGSECDAVSASRGPVPRRSLRP